MMPVWKLSPVARKDDPHWNGYDYREPLLVEAPDGITARRKGTKWYKEHFQISASTMKGQFHRSAFEDEKLYWVTELTEQAAQAEQQEYPLVE